MGFKGAVAFLAYSSVLRRGLLAERASSVSPEGTVVECRLADKAAVKLATMEGSSLRAVGGWNNRERLSKRAVLT